MSKNFSERVNTVLANNAIGNLYVSVAIVTTFPAVSTPVKTLGTTILLPSTEFDSPVDGRLRYIGTETKTFVMMASLSAISGGVDKTYLFYLAKNGVIIPETEISRTLGSVFQGAAISLLGVVSLATNDYIEVWVENATDTTLMALTTLNMVIK